MSALPDVTIYTDGGCIPNPGQGAWAAVLLFTTPDGRKVKKELSGYEPDTTNNRMELQAVIEGLRALKTVCRIMVVTDSQWVANCGARRWGRNKNADLWAQFDEAEALHDVRFEWVRGHAGDRWNELCHQLVTEQLSVPMSKRIR